MIKTYKNQINFILNLVCLEKELIKALNIYNQIF